MGGGKNGEMGSLAPGDGQADLPSLELASGVLSISDTCGMRAACTHVGEGQGAGTPDAVDADGELAGSRCANGTAAAPTVDTGITVALSERCEDEGGVACGDAAPSTIVVDSSAAPSCAPPEQREDEGTAAVADGGGGEASNLSDESTTWVAHTAHVAAALSDVCLGAYELPSEVNRRRAARAAGKLAQRERMAVYAGVACACQPPRISRASRVHWCANTVVHERHGTRQRWQPTFVAVAEASAWSAEAAVRSQRDVVAAACVPRGSAACEASPTAATQEEPPTVSTQPKLSGVDAAAASLRLRVPRSRFVLYLCSGPSRKGGFSQCVARASSGSVHVLCVDTLLHGDAHDLSTDAVGRAVAVLASCHLCVGVLATIPCATFSAANWAPPRRTPPRDIDHPKGAPGLLPRVHARVLAANSIAEWAIAAADAVAAHGGFFIFENPVWRGAGSAYAMRGRERHASLWQLPAMVAFAERHGDCSVCFDQCMVGAVARKSTRLLCSANIEPHLRARLGGRHCNHPRGTHPRTAGVGQPFRTQALELFTEAFNEELAGAAMSAVCDGPGCEACEPERPASPPSVIDLSPIASMPHDERADGGTANVSIAKSGRCSHGGVCSPGGVCGEDGSENCLHTFSTVPPAHEGPCAPSAPHAPRTLSGVQSQASVAPPMAVACLPGSADPHGLRLDDDKVPRSRRRPTFSLAAHQAASGEELARRPVALLNAPCSVPPASPPRPQRAGAPHVTSIDQILTPYWAWRVRQWVKRCQRCLRRAREGDWRAARRLRPADLWVSAAESMQPAVAEWSWDLRPLARGEPAVPVGVSSRDGQPPPGDVCLAAVRALLDEGSFADKGILAEVLDGVADDSAVPRGSLLCAPHTGALQQLAQAASKNAALVEEGWASQYATLPFWPLRCDPYSIVDESARAGRPKFRLTNDHSWPPPGSVAGDGTCVGAWGNHVPSLNEAMERDGWPAARMVRVREVAEAAAVLGASGVPVKASVLDCRAYYKRFGRQLSEHWRNGAVVEGGFVIDERCCFGSAADAAKCTRFSNVLAHAVRQEQRAVDARYPPRDPRLLEWLAQRRAAGEHAGASPSEISEQWACLSAVGIYIDDGSTIGFDDALFDVHGVPALRDGVQLTRAVLHFEAFRAALLRFGHESETSKEQPPAMAVDLLGVTLDLASGRMRLSKGKRRAYAALARSVAARRVCGLRDAQSLLGKLTFASTCYPVGRQWLHAPWRALRAVYRTRAGEIAISHATRSSLMRWAAELERADHDGVPLASRDPLPAAGSPGAAAIYADAALECERAGFGAWAVCGRELLYVQGEWSPAERKLLICDLELAASTLGLVALQPHLACASVYSFTDNTVAMSAMRRLTPSTPAMQAFTADRAAWMLVHGVAESAERVTSAANLWADMLSRGHVAGVEQQAAHLGLSPRRVPVPADWRHAVAVAAHAREGHAGDLRPCAPSHDAPCA